MRTYPALRTISSIIKIITIFEAIVGGLASLVLAAQTWQMSGVLALFYFVGGLFVTGITVLLQWAIAEIILLFVDSAENVAAMKTHLLGDSPATPSPTPQAPAVPSVPTPDAPTVA